MSAPWDSARVEVGVPPQVEALVPRPVLLVCDECGASGYWYPGEELLTVRRRYCPLSPEPGSRAHGWGVLRWNGNAAREAPVSSMAR